MPGVVFTFTFGSTNGFDSFRWVAARMIESRVGFFPAWYRAVMNVCAFAIPYR